MNELECNRKDEHVCMYYALSFIKRLIGDGDQGISPQTAGYIREQIKQAFSDTPIGQLK